MNRRAALILAALATSAAAGRAVAGGEDEAPAAATVELQPVGLPVLSEGRIRNYVFVHVRLHLAPGKDQTQARNRSAHIRDAIVRAAHRVPFTLPDTWLLLSEPRIRAAAEAAARVHLGEGFVVRAEVTSQTPRRRTSMLGT